MGNCHPGKQQKRVYQKQKGDNDGRVDPKAVPAALRNETAAVKHLPESATLKEPSLRRNMTQDKKNDVFTYYESVKVLGIGTMGSVTLVRKKKELIGGSARSPSRKPKSQRNNNCLGLESRLPALIRDESDSSPSTATRGRSATKLQPHRKIPSDFNYEVLYALKTIHLNRISDPNFIQELRNEIDILKSLDHPNIVRAIETFEFKGQICFLMDLCSGGDLYTRDPYTEEQARRIVKKLTSAVEYMHRHDIIHRGTL